tara:strand:+ start:190 stop:1641 length:1452 start_codon:yes stop_codon:yes gene_type:complete
MKIIELLIDELDKLSGFDAVALVEEPAIEADFFAFKKEDLEDIITFELIKQGFKDQFVEKIPGESKEDYMQRCLPVLKSEGFPEEQALAICYDTYDIDVSNLPDYTNHQTESYSNHDLHFDVSVIKTDEGNKYVMNGELTPDLHLVTGNTYCFDQSNPSNDTHELRISVTKDGTHNGGTEYTNGVAIVGKKLYLQASKSTPKELYYYCVNHPGMANDARIYVHAHESENFQSYTDYPQAASNNAKRALRWAEKNGWGSCGTAVGKARANQLAKREPISEDTIARMASFERHRRNSDKELGDGCGRLVWLAWGGDEGIAWAQRKLKQIRKEEQSKDKPSETFSLVSQENKHSFALESDQMRVIGPLMVPDKLIKRIDAEGNEYFVYFSKETIRQIADKMMKNKLLDKMNLEHDPKQPVEGYMVESWIVEDSFKDKSSNYGFDVPEGTWMGMYQIENEDIWELVKNKQVKAFSIEGWFSDRLIQN